MSSVDSDKHFVGQIPANYERYLVPLIFDAYAAPLAQRVVKYPADRVLELAAGTGVLTRALARALAPEATLEATDLNPTMLDHGRQIGATRPVVWNQADAMSLPYEDESFDVVVCQFGAMFFADKVRAFAEARRVLRQNGTFLFSVWDRIEENEFAAAVTQALEGAFPDDPPRFLERTPHGYFDRELIFRDVRAAGYSSSLHFETIEARSRAESGWIPAVAYCQGTPLRNEIEARDIGGLGHATDVAARYIAQRFGDGSVDGKIQAHLAVVQA